MSTIWHELECGGYGADLALWEELAAEAGGDVLDLGCGSGRVSLHLARNGRSACGLDLDPELIAAFEERAATLSATATVGDARDFDLGRRFGLILAPMQLLQLFAGEEERRRCLGCIATHLDEGGLAGVAIVESMPAAADDLPPPLPDAREADGWIYSSLPLDAQLDSGAIRVRRLRQTVSPQGRLEEELYEVELQALDAAALEAEAQLAGLRAAGRRAIPATDEHVGATVVLLEGTA